MNMRIPAPVAAASVPLALGACGIVPKKRRRFGGGVEVPSLGHEGEGEGKGVARTGALAIALPSRVQVGPVQRPRQ